MYVWCETWFTTLRRRGVFENRVLKKILGASREEVMEGRRKSRNEGLRDLYLSFDIIWGDQKNRI
jgi:PAS domain-containing protein